MPDRSERARDESVDSGHRWGKPARRMPPWRHGCTSGAGSLSAVRPLTGPSDGASTTDLPVLGLDGRRGRWCGALLTRGEAHFLDLAGRLDLLAAAGPPERPADGVVAIGIDTPIGLPAREPRRCDLAARRLLRRGGGASRVFLAPPRAVLREPTHAGAVAVSRCPGSRAAGRRGRWVRLRRVAKPHRACVTAPTVDPGRCSVENRPAGPAALELEEPLGAGHQHAAVPELAGRLTPGSRGDHRAEERDPR